MNFTTYWPSSYLSPCFIVDDTSYKTIKPAPSVRGEMAVAIFSLADWHENDVGFFKLFILIQNIRNKNVSSKKQFALNLFL